MRRSRIEMCGIAGKLSSDGPVDRALIDRMSATLRHRGPDAGGAFCEHGVGLGVRRLAIIDVEGGDQPIFSEDSSTVVVLNGEIYNYRELRAELEARGHSFSTRTDTEVIVHLYEELGDACVERLRGMFAFALWDRRRRRALIARDRLGKKPLLYAQIGGELWFGSEAKAIVQDPVVPRHIDYAAIDRYLHHQYVPSPDSAFAGLRKLPPAHLMTWSDGEIVVERYWKAAFGPKLEADAPELEERLREELLEATRIRLRSDVPLGALLSGGIDSSAVVAAAARVGSGRLRTFSIGFRERTHDERPYARQVASLYDTDHHELVVEPSVAELLPRLVWHYDEPFADHSAIPSFALAEITRRHVTVALNGDGGDESFAGYDRYLLSRRALRAEWVPKGLWRAAERTLAAAGTPPDTASRASRARRALDLLSQEPWRRYANYVAIFRARARRRLYRPEFRRWLDAESALGVIGDPYAASDAEDAIERLLDVDQQTYLPGDLLVKMDIASMAHSLEVRSPLLDHRIVELAAAMPIGMKLRGRERKLVLRNALRPWLPDSILDRPKRGFAVPLIEWFRGPLRDLPGEILLDPASTARGVFEPREVEKLIDDHVAGRANNASRLWSLIQLELWTRTFIDPPAPAPISREWSGAPVARTS